MSKTLTSTGRQARGRLTCSPSLCVGICGSDLHEVSRLRCILWCLPSHGRLAAQEADRFRSRHSSQYYGGPHTCRAAGCPHPLTGETVPATLGHENSGTIVEVHPSLAGSDLGERFVVGTRVCIEPVISCLECEPCLKGDRGLCLVGIGFFGYNRPGGLARYMNVTAQNLHKIPDNVPRE